MRTTSQAWANFWQIIIMSHEDPLITQMHKQIMSMIGTVACAVGPTRMGRATMVAWPARKSSRAGALFAPSALQLCAHSNLLAGSSGRLPVEVGPGDSARRELAPLPARATRNSRSRGSHSSGQASLFICSRLCVAHLARALPSGAGATGRPAYHYCARKLEQAARLARQG